MSGLWSCNKCQRKECSSHKTSLTATAAKQIRRQYRELQNLFTTLGCNCTLHLLQRPWNDLIIPLTKRVFAGIHSMAAFLPFQVFRSTWLIPLPHPNAPSWDSFNPHTILYGVGWGGASWRGHSSLWDTYIWIVYVVHRFKNGNPKRHLLRWDWTACSKGRRCSRVRWLTQLRGPMWISDRKRGTRIFTRLS